MMKRIATFSSLVTVKFADIIFVLIASCALK